MISTKTPSTQLRGPEEVRADFPFFEAADFAYLDSASSAQKPRKVIEAMTKFYSEEYSNIHRGVYKFAELATLRYEDARRTVAEFIRAPHAHEIVFTHGTTESINLVAHAWGNSVLRSGDEILLGVLEHHANIVPWQLLAQRTGAKVRFVALGRNGEFDTEAFLSAINSKTRLVAITQLSNAIGIAPPLELLIPAAKAVGAKVLVDGAQGVSHLATDVGAMGADFYAFSAHKLYGPTGVGVLWAKSEILEEMSPFLAGGDMIAHVSIEGTSFREPPFRFEAGTPHVAGVIGLAAAIDYLESCDLQACFDAESKLLAIALEALSGISGVRILAPDAKRHALISFVIDGIHPHDVAQGFSSHAVAVRAGHHCAQPLAKSLGITASTRMSLGIYSNKEDVKSFVSALEKLITFFKR